MNEEVEQLIAESNDTMAEILDGYTAFEKASMTEYDNIRAIDALRMAVIALTIAVESK